MSCDRSYKDAFELCDDVEEEEASSINSDEEEEHKEFIESSEKVPIEVESSLLSSLTTQLVFLVLSPPIIPFTFISRKICLCV